VIAATGEEVKVVEGDGEKIWEFKGHMVRDFAWVASNKFQRSSAVVGDTTIYSYYYTQDRGNKALEFGHPPWRSSMNSLEPIHTRIYP